MASPNPSPPARSLLGATVRAYARGTLVSAIVVVVALFVLEALALDVLTDRGPSLAGSLRPWPLRGGIARIGVDLGLVAIVLAAMRRSLVGGLSARLGLALDRRDSWMSAAVGVAGIYPIAPLTLPLRAPVALAILVMIVRARARPGVAHPPSSVLRIAAIACALAGLACLGWAARASVLHPLHPGSAGQSDGAVKEIAAIDGVSTFRFHPDRSSVFPVEIENEGLAAATIIGLVTLPGGAEPLRVTGLRISPPIPAEDKPALTLATTRPFTPVRIPGRSTAVLALVLEVGSCATGDRPRPISSIDLRYRVLGQRERQMIHLTPSIAAACGTG